MSLKTTAAPCALLLAALAGPAFAQQPATPPSEPTVLDSVIVTARRNADDPAVVAEARARLSRTPGAVAVVSAESYADRYAPNLADVLRDAPGVYAQKKWGGDIRLSIRGSGIGNSSHNRGTLLAQDGVPFNEADGFGDFQLIDPLIARYTEVYKGGNALRLANNTWHDGASWKNSLGDGAIIQLEGQDIAFMRHANGTPTTMARLTPAGYLAIGPNLPQNPGAGSGYLYVNNASACTVTFCAPETVPTCAAPNHYPTFIPGIYAKGIINYTRELYAQIEKYDAFGNPTGVTGDMIVMMHPNAPMTEILGKIRVKNELTTYLCCPK